jgi:hypothetical protein
VKGGPEIVFGRAANQVSHAFRHTDVLGLDRAEVMEAITQDLRRHLPLRVPTTKNFMFVGTVTVRGIELRYRAYPLNEDLVNVGRIAGP